MQETCLIWKWAEMPCALQMSKASVRGNLGSSCQFSDTIMCRRASGKADGLVKQSVFGAFFFGVRSQLSNLLGFCKRWCSLCSWDNFLCSFCCYECQNASPYSIWMLKLHQMMHLELVSSYSWTFNWLNCVVAPLSIQVSCYLCWTLHMEIGC